MDEVKRLRERIGRVEKNAQGRRPYGERLRSDLLDFTKREVGRGRSITKTAELLGLNPATLVNWLRNESERDAIPMYPVEVVGDGVGRDGGQRVAVAADATTSTSALVLELGSGVRVLGLQLEQLTELVRRLR